MTGGWVENFPEDVKKIKGDIKTGTKQTYSNANAIGDIDIKPGNVYLITYFDENNPTDIFEVTSYDTKTLKLKNVEGDMWERFEKYLNEGKCEIILTNSGTNMYSETVEIVAVAVRACTLLAFPEIHLL